MNISVCMATYNGSKHVHKQISSILPQLDDQDEIIVVDDASQDNTRELVLQFDDPRVKLFSNNKNLGVVSTFERAIRLSTGQLIFLSDQDDVWFENKAADIKKIFESQRADLIVHNAVIVNHGTIADQSLFSYRNSSPGVIKNIISNTYIGCCMAFRRDALNGILPIPLRKGILHDAWIGILAKFYRKKIVFMELPLIQFRRHVDNATTLNRRNIFKILSERSVFLYALSMRILSNWFKPSSTERLA